MDSAHQPFLDEAQTLLGPRGLTRDPDLLEPWLTDWRGRFTGAALALASPADVAEVAALVRLCGKHGVPIVPQGGNSGMSGGATPDSSGAALILSLRRMNAIRTLDPAARQLTCEAGVVLQVLHEAATDLDADVAAMLQLAQEEAQLELAAIDQAGQGIVMGQLENLVSRALAFRGIAEDGDMVGDLP